MSGFAGIVQLDGSAVDGRLLRRMTDSLAVRGPDGRQIWIKGPVGLGHALLRTTDDPDAAGQPTSLDGQVWITADARIDGRADLVGELNARGCHPVLHASDAQLILHAYGTWGEQCVDHLLGDFAFAIWDAGARRLFCARDHFGIKPFYYAQVLGGIVFSNTLDCIRLHPAVSDGLNEVAIGDFLLFGWNQDPSTTTFADVRRLAAAHTLTCEQGTSRAHRYWTVPADGRIRYRHADEYVDHFKQLLRVAVGDRLRTTSVSVCMSGGLDSTSIAATARQLMSERGGGSQLRAQTIVYDRLIPDEERHYAGLAGEALGVPTSFFPADDYRPFDGWDDSGLHTPEPTSDPFLLMRLQLLRRVATESRVLLCGDGGDEVFWSSYVVDLIGKMKLTELGGDLARSLALYRKRPGAGVRATLEKRILRSRSRPACPSWLNSAFVERMDLRDRYEQLTASPPIHEHPLRPEAYRRLTGPLWAWCLGWWDPGVTRLPLEARYPYLDVRLVSYLLAIPPLPWFVDKLLLREAMRGVLPERVVSRVKSPLRDDPLRAHLRVGLHVARDSGAWTPALAGCVDLAAVPRLDGRDRQDPWIDVRPLCLNYWLNRVHSCAPCH